MKNLVEIKYNTNDKYPHVSINGEEITRFSALASYIYDDIFRWANVFFELIDGDLADNYRVSLTGHPYQAFVLRSAAEKSEYCEGVDFKDYDCKISMYEKYSFACRLQSTDGNEAQKLTFRVRDEETFACYASDSLVISTEGDSIYCLAENDEDAEALSGKYCIILSDKNAVVKKKNNVYFFYVKEGMLPLALDYFLSYHLYLVVVGDVLTNADKYCESKKAALEFEAYTQEDYRIWAEALPEHVDVGFTTPWGFKVFPDCFSSDSFVVCSSDPSVISYENGKIIANESGKASICIKNSSGKEYFSQTVTVEHHNYAKNITLIIPSTMLFVGDTMHFRIIVSPINAEDADQITCSVSDERVAVLTNPNELYAISSGRVCVTVSTPRVSAKMYITVPAQACDVMLSSEGSLTLPCSAEATIYGSVFPSNSIPLPDLEWSVAKGGEKVIKICTANNQKCVIQSNEPGQTTLICHLKDTNIEKRLIVSVPKPKGCYIATAVYGSYDCPEVWVLRRYRDEYLDTRPLGRLFIKLYYAVSPTIVRIFGKTVAFNSFWKRFLNRKIEKLKKKGYDSTPYDDKDY